MILTFVFGDELNEICRTRKDPLMEKKEAAGIVTTRRKRRRRRREREKDR